VESVVIVGFGAAGLACAEALRQAGWAGRLTILSAETEPPYDRPPLSKQYLSGEWDARKLLLAGEKRIDALGADIRWGRSAVAVDTAARVVVDDAGETHPYDGLVIAVGVQPVRIPGTDVPGMHVLRTREDADGLREALAADDGLLVVGGGFLGLEVAAGARELGKDVTVVEPLPLPLGTKLPEQVARRLVALHRAHGVEVLAGVGLSSVALDDGRLSGVVLDDGREVPARTALMAVGARPRLAWLDGSGLVVEDGIVCDDHCRAASRVWAAGDVARWQHRGLGRSIRLEHRMNATEQGRYVARDVLGLEDGPFVPTPFFWTDHFGVRVQSAGDPEPPVAAAFAEGDEGADSFLLEYRDDGRLLAGIGWNAPRSLVAVRRELSGVPA